jgi:putative inorganic carbon (HCO3(-)) transporter
LNALAQIGGPLSALGVLGLLLGDNRAIRLAGLGLVAGGGALVFTPIVPSVGSAFLAAGALAGVVIVGALAFAFFRWTWLLPVLALSCVAARLPFKLNGSTYNLLVPLYVVIGAATVVLAYEIFRGDERARELGPIAWPLAAFVAWSSLSLVWSPDVHEGSIYLDAFLLPFTLLAVVLVRLRWSRRLLLGLLAELVTMALVFTFVGIYQWQTREIFWNQKLGVSNAYAPFFRVNSVFWDPSVYGRFLVVAMLGCLVLVLARARRPWLAAATVAIVVLWIGLLLSFSQSSFAALLAGVVAAALFTWRWRAAIPLTIAAVLVAGLGLATPQLRAKLFDKTHGGLNSITSTRTTLVVRGIRIAVDHPLIGVGVGGFNHAYGELAGIRGLKLSKVASHTTPVTVAAETGAAGLALYVWLLAVALVLAFQRAGPSFSGRVQLVCAIALAAIAVHSLFYASFFEDPMVWGFLAIVVGASAGLARETSAA